MANTPNASINADHLSRLVADVFIWQGVRAADAKIAATSLVHADLEGIPSHGVTLVPMYVSRLKAKSINAAAVPAIAEDHGALVVMDADNALGQVSAVSAVELAIDRASLHAVSVVAVRNGFHFGTAGYWARQIACTDMVGIALSNTRPLMPAPGGAERVVGNNPLAIAFPSDTGEPLVVDMAMSATAMGKIRLADAQGRSIPPGWATNARGEPTTAPKEAIDGMLLPAGGPKGFGLALAIDLLCGALSGGGIGAAVRSLYAQIDEFYNCAHAFVAIDARRTNLGAGIASQVAARADDIRRSKRAAGTERLYAPGDIERAHLDASNNHCLLTPELVEELQALAAQAGSNAVISPYSNLEDHS